MKHTNRIFALLLALTLLCLCGCAGEEAPTGLWETATYTADTELGEGSKTVTVAVTAEETTVTFTIHTDAETLGDALLAEELIAGEDSAYGLYITAVNGMTADYDANKSYWAFYEGGEYAMTGVDGEAISGGEEYALVYTIG